jgi:hypothetical protein
MPRMAKGELVPPPSHKSAQKPSRPSWSAPSCQVNSNYPRCRDMREREREREGDDNHGQCLKVGEENSISRPTKKQIVGFILRAIIIIII